MKLEFTFYYMYVSGCRTGNYNLLYVSGCRTWPWHASVIQNVEPTRGELASFGTSAPLSSTPTPTREP